MKVLVQFHKLASFQIITNISKENEEHIHTVMDLQSVILISTMPRHRYAQTQSSQTRSFQVLHSVCEMNVTLVRSFPVPYPTPPYNTRHTVQAIIGKFSSRSDLMTH